MIAEAGIHELQRNRREDLRNHEYTHPPSSPRPPSALFASSAREYIKREIENFGANDYIEEDLFR